MDALVATEAQLEQSIYRVHELGQPSPNPIMLGNVIRNRFWSGLQSWPYWLKRDAFPFRSPSEREPEVEGFDLSAGPVMRSCNSAHVGPS